MPHADAGRGRPERPVLQAYTGEVQRLPRQRCPPATDQEVTDASQLNPCLSRHLGWLYASVRLLPIRTVVAAAHGQ